MIKLNYANKSELLNEVTKLKKIAPNVYVKDDLVLKIYDDLYLSKYKDSIIEKNIIKSNINIENACFPVGLIYIGDVIHGDITKYIKGKNGEDNYFSKIDINIFTRALDNLTMMIKEISRSNVLITDPYYKNIIFDGKNFNLVDLSESIIINKDKEFIYKENMINIMYELLGSIFNFSEPSLYEYLTEINSKYKNFLYEDDLYMLNPSTLVKNILQEIEEYNNKTYSNFREIQEDVFCNVVNTKKVK